MRLSVVTTTRTELTGRARSMVDYLFGGRYKATVEAAAPGVWRVVIDDLGEEIWGMIDKLEHWGYRPYAMPDDVKQTVRLVVHFDEVLNLKLVEDYSAFGELTQYEKTVVDRLRAEGLADSEIKRMLKEL